MCKVRLSCKSPKSFTETFCPGDVLLPASQEILLRDHESRYALIVCGLLPVTDGLPIRGAIACELTEHELLNQSSQILGQITSAAYLYLLQGKP